ncbi:MAG: hypothetical protein ACI9VS_000516 [Candidatus Binatia bacterium]|jgi:uncharacterized protein (TIGR00730 family)
MSRSATRAAIKDLIRRQPGDHNADLVENIVEHALKLLSDVEHRGDVRVIESAIDELGYAFKTFEPYAGRRKVTVFGSARTQPEQVEYQQCVDFSSRMAEAGYMVITGAGPGIMHAGHEGAGKDMSWGVNISLPWEQGANPVIQEDEKLINFKYFFTRKLMFVRQCHAVALFPGGFGTMDEAFETLTLLQTGKCQPLPLVLVDRPGGTYWKTWDRYVKDHLLRNKLISREDLNLYQMTDDAGAAVKQITGFYRNYHSCRWVKNRLVIRLQNRPSRSAVLALNEDFEDIVKGAKFRVIQPTPEEVADGDELDLPRLAFGFDQKSYARLRRLIDVLNRL